MPSAPSNMLASLRFIMSSGLIFLRGIRFGSQDPTPQVSTPTLQFVTAFSSTALSQESGLRPKTAMSGIKCPNNDCNQVENRAMQGIARSCHETLNGRLKAWGILANTYCHRIMEHGTVFHVWVVITQLSGANGEPLFRVEYRDE